MNAILSVVRSVDNFIYPEDLDLYQHEGVIGKFRDEWDIEEQEALEIFSEMKKFLFCSEYAQRRGIEFEISEPILMIDKMWHHFVMFTIDYAKFCDKFFGKMLHHVPFCAAHLAQMIKELSQKGVTLNDHKRDRLEKQLQVIETTLGVETIKKWYVDYSNKYTPEKMNMLQRPIYHGDLNKLSVPIDQIAANQMTSKELIQEIVRQISPSMYCGMPGCGPFCSCNVTPRT